MRGSMTNDISYDYAHDKTQDTNQRPYTSMRNSQEYLDKSQNPLLSAQGEVHRVNSWANHDAHRTNSSANNLKRMLNDMSDQDENHLQSSANEYGIYGMSPKPSMFRK